MHTLASIIVLMTLFIGIWGIMLIKKGISPAVTITAIAALVGAVILALRTGRAPHRDSVVRIKGKRAR